MTITIENLTVHYPGAAHAALQNISVTFPTRAVTLIVGRSGSGKTTLLDVLSGLMRPTAGTILFGDSPLWQGKRVDAPTGLRTGTVFQHPEQQLFGRTVDHEFRYSLRPFKLSPSMQDARIRSALNAVHLSDSVLPESPFSLSVGQRRRVALATTLACAPEWLFLDEPTAGLDAEATESLLLYLSHHRHLQSHGIVVATHDLDTFLPFADRVIILHNGRLEAVESPTSLLINPGPLIRAGAGLPERARLALALSNIGLSVRATDEPDEMADSILAQLQSIPVTTPFDVQKAATAVDASQNTSNAPVATTLATSGPNFYEQFDPRVKWIAYLLVSAAILLQHRASILGLSSAFTVAAVAMAGRRVTGILRLLRPLTLFATVSVLLSGLSFHGAHGRTVPLGFAIFSLDPALVTGMNLWKLLLVTTLGFVLTTTTSQLHLKRGIERLLSPLNRLGVSTELVSLGMSMVLRMIPIILREWSRFSRIARVRGKSHAAAGKIGWDHAPAILIPFMISLLQFADDLSTAMEARGYTHLRQKRTSSVMLRLRRRDVEMLITSGIGALLLFWLRNR